MPGLITPKRIAIAAVCVASLVVCCGLAYWQWDRFSQTGGSFQNLGYVFQWPLFGLFPAFMVWRFRRLESRRKAELAAAGATGRAPDQAVNQVTDRVANPAVPEPVAGPAKPVVTVEPVRAPVHDDEDDELAAYNRMLAELNARDQR